MSAKLPLVYACSGCSSAAQMANHFALKLDREGVAYTTVDIEEDPAAADYVMSVNGGNQTVPTVVFSDGSALTNPSLAQVKDKLAA